MRGEDNAGIEHMQRAITGWQATGMASARTAWSWSWRMGAWLRPAGARQRDALTPSVSLLAIGLAAIEPLLGPDVPCGQSYQAELHRLKGELLLERDGLAAADEALACFEQAMQLGREMGALAWQLRAAMSLVRLRLRQGEAMR